MQAYLPAFTSLLPVGAHLPNFFISAKLLSVAGCRRCQVTDMDSNQDSPTLTPRPTGKKRSAVRWVFAGLLCLLALGLIVLFVAPAETEKQIVWLTPAQAQETHPAENGGPLARVRQSAKNLVVRMQHYFFENSPSRKILSHFQIFSISPLANLTALLGPPASTNVDGRQAWLLSPSDYVALIPNLEREKGFTELFSMGGEDANGQQGQMRIGSVIPVGLTNRLPPGQRRPLAAPVVFAGTAIDFVPKSVPGAQRLVRLQVTVSSTAAAGTATSNVVIRTNFFTASRTLVQSDGALVIECPNANSTNPTNFLLLVSPTTEWRVIDAEPEVPGSPAFGSNRGTQ